MTVLASETNTADTMVRSMLSTIESAGQRVKRKAAGHTSRCLLTSDIEGAQAGTWRRRKKTNRQFSSLTTADIDGARPTVLIPKSPNKRRDFHLNCSDIRGAMPTRRNATRRRVNPVDPSYQLPSYDHEQASPPKQLRNVPYCSDITTYRPQLKTNCNAKKIDVEGSKPRPAPPAAKTSYLLDAKSINGRQKQRGRIHQPSNPLEPRYVYDVPKNIKNMGSEAISLWADKNATPDPRSKPCAMPPKKTDMRFAMLSLSTDGIDLSCPADPRIPLHFPIKRRHYRETNYVADIDGAFPSYKKGTFYKERRNGRGTHPGNPDYSVASAFDLLFGEEGGTT